MAVARRIASFARGLLALAALLAGAPALAQSAAITASSPATLNQGNLRGATVSVTLTSATYQSTVAASHFTLTTTIPGLTVHSVGLNTGSTVATLRLHYDGSDFNTAATIAVTVAAAGTSHNAALTTSTQAVGLARWVNVSAKAIALTEGGTGTYTVALESPPTGNVTVTVTSDHTAAVTRSPNTLTFTTTTWSTPQTVTLTAVADNTDTVDEVALVTNVATGGGYADNATANRTVRATVADDDSRTGTDYDTDDDGLIEISNHAQLNAVQWDLDGNGSSLNSGYSTGSTSAFPSPAAGMGCPDTSDSNQTGNCTGYELMADIDLDTDGDGMADSGDAYWRSGKGWDPLGDQAKKTSSPFTATLRGNGHSISNLYSRDEFPSTGAGFGFFATIRFARIESLALLDVDIGDGSGSGSPGDLAGTLAASIESSTLAGVYVTGSVTPHSTGTTPTGGLAGNCGGATIQNTYTNVAIGYGYNVAGFIGESTNATDSQSGAGDNMTFGACEIYNSFAVGSVSGSGTRSSTRVSSDGGLVAEPPQPSTTYITSRDAYWDTQTTGKSSSSGSPNSDGKTTAQLKGPTAATGIFAFWDDYDTDGDGRVDADDAAWDFGTSTEYPVLTWGGHTAVGQLGRVANTAPSFGMGSVTAQTFAINTPITEFVVPAASGGEGTITYTASNLPDGLVFDATGTDTPGCTGSEAREICGTPTTATTAQTVTITAQDGDTDRTATDRATLTFDVTVNAPPSFGSGSVTDKTYIAASPIMEFQVPAASGGNGTITYTESGLPTGLIFDATGTDAGGCPGNQAREICGTPTTAASAVTVTITADDADSDMTSGDRGTLTFMVTVSANLVPSFGSGSVTAKTYVAGQAITAFTVPAASGGNGAIDYAASNLPDGLVFDATGSDSPGCPGSQARRVCGTPTTAAAAATVTITAQDGDANMGAGDRGLLTFSVTVETDTAPNFGSGSVNNRIVGVNAAIAEFQVPAATGGNGTITYTASGLPTGLVFDATGSDTPGCTGAEAREICGTPTVLGGPTTVTITARDSDANTMNTDRDTLTFTITVSSDAPPSFGSGSVPEKAFILNAAITDFVVPAASGGNGTITYVASGLPTGLVFDATGTDSGGCSGTEAREICGTPSVAGTGTITITADDGDTNMAPGDRATLSFAYSVAADTAPTFSGSVTAKTYPAGQAITDFVVPAASGGNGTLSYAASNLPSGLVFDATGTDTPGCAGTEAREVCGTPDAATAGAVTVTITATDLDTNTAGTDSASLTFTVTVNAGASLASSPSPLTEANLNGAGLTVTLVGATYGSGVSASSFQLVTAPTIAGLSIGSVSGGASGSTTATLALATGAGYGFNAASTVAVTVLAAAHSGPSNLTTGTLPVTPTPPSVLVSRRSLSLNEDPGAGAANRSTYTLVLSEAPTGCTGGVGVSVSGGNPDLTVDPITLAFSTTTWNAPQTVTVTAGQDDDSETESVTLRHSISTACAAAGYPATLAIPSVQVTVADDDAPPLPNEPPVAVGSVDDVDLALGETARVALAGLFTDEEPELLTYAVSSSNPTVVAARLAWPAVAVEGVGHGGATVTVTATDPEGLSASLGFEVRSGVTVSFAADASAPEGGTLRLTLTASRPVPEALAVPYTLMAGDDPAADESDHDGGTGGTATFAAGATRAEISVPILDDDVVEPLREHFIATLAEPAEDAGYGLGLKADATATIDEGVCDRDPAVRDELRRTRPCEAVADLSRWTSLRLRDAGLERLRGEDLLQLSNLLLLDVSNNRLAAFPAAALAALPNLWSLQLRGNRIDAPPAGLKHPALRLLDLSGNRLAELPANALSGLAGLRRLHLSGNALTALPGGAFAGLGSLRALRLDGNRLATLPAGLFAGLGALEELHLHGNPGAPFMLAIGLSRTDADPWLPGPAMVAARVAEGAPFTLRAALAGGPAGQVSVPAGATRGEPVEVADGGAPLTLTARPEPVPDDRCEQGLVDVPCFSGFATVAGEPLTLYKVPPRATTLPEQALDGDALRLPLAERFNAAPGEAFTYAAQSSDPSVASVRVEAGVLVVEAEGDGVATVTVTATDAHGQMGTLAFTVRATLPIRGGLRGWRLILVEGPPDA